MARARNVGTPRALVGLPLAAVALQASGSAMIGRVLFLVALQASGSAMIGRVLFLRQLGRHLQFATPLYELPGGYQTPVGI